VVAASQGAPNVGEITGDIQNQITNALDTLKQYATDILPNRADSVDATYLDGLWYDDNKPGNSSVINIMEFSFRTDEQYKVPDFMLYEDRWQQMARMGDKIPNKWTEKPVKTALGGDTYPFPGKAKLVDEDTYSTQELSIVEAAGGNLRDKNRGSGASLADAYANPQFQAAQKKKINGEYPIVGSDN
jgi:hypothetical protein